jgi:tRNA threonylcarbamoyladenosine biosynthesis protein TsaE
MPIYLSRFGLFIKLSYYVNMKIITSSPHATEHLGLTLAKKTKSGQIFALVGDLGGGKTVLAKGLARGFGIKKLIASPTFILMKVYKIKHHTIKYFCHIDLYRLKKPRDARDIGLPEFLGRKDVVVVIEWANKIKMLLSAYNKTLVRFVWVNNNSRAITITKTKKH